MAYEMRDFQGEGPYIKWTAREHLAAMAMQGICFDIRGLDDRLTSREDATAAEVYRIIAVLAFGVADAMLDEAERRGGEAGDE